MTFVVLALICILVLAAIPIAALLALLSFGIDFSVMGGRLTPAFAEFYWEKSREYVLVSVPMFILMGELLTRSGVATRMYKAIASWLTWMPGGLMHANIGAAALSAATSGSSVATAAMIGTVSYPEIKANGYSERLFLGTVAAGGTLGILIPPSIVLIIYGVLTNTSVPELYIAGVVPGIALAAMFMLVVLIACIIRPGLGGARIRSTWGERLRTLPDLIPPLVIFLAVVGAIYAGWATPTEAASLGVCVSIVIAAAFRSLSVDLLLRCFEGTLKTTAMIMIIVFVANFLNLLLGFTGISRALMVTVESFGLTAVETVLILIVFYLILGMFMESMSMLLTTVPIVYPIIQHLNVPAYDGVWFGILVTMLIEIALITPPIGINLYVVQSIRDPGGNFIDVALGALPFVAAMMTMILALVAFPTIATWLPDLVYR